MTAGQRFARAVTTVVVRVPFLWRAFRGTMTRQFDGLAPAWDARLQDPTRMVAMRAALGHVPPPARVLDVGTGTGRVARLAAELWPGADVTGVDVSPRMIEEAKRLASTDRERYEVADSSSLPFPDGTFELVTLNNMIPFFDEVARVTAPGGHVAVAFGNGADTPIYVPLARVRRELERRGFAHVADFDGRPSIALLARKHDRS